MSGSIFLIDAAGGLQELEQREYVAEERLQALLAEHPELLAGDQLDVDRPRRWLLVAREYGVPGEADGGGRWALDHLFIDQDAIPTFVEVKRSTDTRIRREMVGQMLDYAANGTAYWRAEDVRTAFERRCQSEGVNPHERVCAITDAGVEYEAFWNTVATNLQAGRVRVLFVADSIPPELRTVVQFLNEQMSPAEVLAIEIRQFEGQGLRTLVPRVLGDSASARNRHARAARRQWDEASYMSELLARTSPQHVEIAQRLLSWSYDRGLRVFWGQGMRNGSFIPVADLQHRSHQLYAALTSGAIEVYFQWHARKPPFADEAKRREMARRLNAIEGIDFTDDVLRGRPSFPMELLSSESDMAAFLSCFDWFLEEVRKPSGEQPSAEGTTDHQ